MAGFGSRLADAMAARGPLCLGIDPATGWSVGDLLSAERPP